MLYQLCALCVDKIQNTIFMNDFEQFIKFWKKRRDFQFPFDLKIDNINIWILQQTKKQKSAISFEQINKIKFNILFFYFLFSADINERCQTFGHVNRCQSEMDIWIQVVFQRVLIRLHMKIQMHIYTIIHWCVITIWR